MHLSSLAARLRHVLWIGGAPCSGKSTIVARLAQRHLLTPYSCDDAFGRHAAQATAEEHPEFYRVSRSSWDEIWMRPPEVLLADEVAIYRQEFPMVLDDLLALPADRPVIAEGAALMPHLVAPLLSDPRQGVWIVPTEPFLRQHYPGRGEWVQAILAQCSRPDEALDRWLGRDAAFAAGVSEEATRIGLPVLRVDGSRTIEQNAAWVEGQFAFALERGRV